VFVELPKFQPRSIAEKKMAVLWLRFLTEISEETKVAPKELLENEQTRKALEIIEFAAEGRKRVKDQLYLIDETFRAEPAKFEYELLNSGDKVSEDSGRD